jgi:DNA-binding NtrC family response regulator
MEPTQAGYQPENASIRKKKKCILLIEDEPTVSDIARAMLEALKCQVVSAPDGRSALKIVEEAKIPLDLVLMDIGLPDIPGERLFSRLKSINPGIKVVVVSGGALDEHVAKLLSEGCLGFIQKPFTLKTMAEEIKIAMA